MNNANVSIRWQVMKGLTHDAHDAIAAERCRVATEGWGAKLLALPSPAGGRWDEGGDDGSTCDCGRLLS